MFKGWDPAWETMPYPATTGQYALYTTQDFYDHLNYAMTNVSIRKYLIYNLFFWINIFLSLCILIFLRVETKQLLYNNMLKWNIVIQGTGKLIMLLKNFFCLFSINVFLLAELWK